VIKLAISSLLAWTVVLPVGAMELTKSRPQMVPLLARCAISSEGMRVTIKPGSETPAVQETVATLQSAVTQFSASFRAIVHGRVVVIESMDAEDNKSLPLGMDDYIESAWVSAEPATAVHELFHLIFARTFLSEKFTLVSRAKAELADLEAQPTPSAEVIERMRRLKLNFNDGLFAVNFVREYAELLCDTAAYVITDKPHAIPEFLSHQVGPVAAPQYMRMRGFVPGFKWTKRDVQWANIDAHLYFAEVNSMLGEWMEGKDLPGRLAILKALYRAVVRDFEMNTFAQSDVLKPWAFVDPAGDNGRLLVLLKQELGNP
jgi:hypothetical protein